MFLLCKSAKKITHSEVWTSLIRACMKRGVHTTYRSPHCHITKQKVSSTFAVTHFRGKNIPSIHEMFALQGSPEA